MKLSKKIFKELKKDFKGLKKEKVEIEDFIIKGGFISFNNTKIKAFPLSIGYSGDEHIAGEFSYIDNLRGDILLKRDLLRDKILYVKDIDKHILFKYLFLIKPKAVITNSTFGRKVYSKDFPILNIYSFLRKNITNLEIKIDIERRKYKSQNIFIDFGIGGKFIIVMFPYDSRFQKFESLDFYSSFKVFHYLLFRFKKFKSELYRVRFLAVDFKYTNYLPLYENIKHIENIVAIYNIENTGLGNEKLVIKTYRYIIDKTHYKSIMRYFEKNRKNIKPVKSEEFIIFPKNIPIVWLNSQPNYNLYKLGKNFSSEDLILESSKDIFEIITNTYKEIEIDV